MHIETQGHHKRDIKAVDKSSGAAEIKIDVAKTIGNSSETKSNLGNSKILAWILKKLKMIEFIENSRTGKFLYIPIKDIS